MLVTFCVINSVPPKSDFGSFWQKGQAEEDFFQTGFSIMVIFIHNFLQKSVKSEQKHSKLSNFFLNGTFILFKNCTTENHCVLGREIKTNVSTFSGSFFTFHFFGFVRLFFEKFSTSPMVPLQFFKFFSTTWIFIKVPHFTILPTLLLLSLRNSVHFRPSRLVHL